jgi:hypothetical protein
LRTVNIVTKPYSTVNDWVQKLDIAEGLKQLLIDADFTIESIIDLGYRELSQMLHIDPYVGKLIVEAAQNVIQEKDPSRDIP